MSRDPVAPYINAPKSQGFIVIRSSDGVLEIAESVEERHFLFVEAGDGDGSVGFHLNRMEAAALRDYLTRMVGEKETEQPVGKAPTG